MTTDSQIESERELTSGSRSAGVSGYISERPQWDNLRAGASQTFSTIVADPPWRYAKWGKASAAAYLVSGITEATNKESPLPYPAMSVDEICALNVAALAGENCELYLWTTEKYLPDSFRVLCCWGFKYCETLVWCKTPRGTGQGGLYCPTTEFLIHGRKGRMPEKARRDSTWWHVTRPHNNHSAKPEFFTDLIEAMTEPPRIELFARRNRLGWSTWGNECLNHIGAVAPAAQKYNGAVSDAT